MLSKVIEIDGEPALVLPESLVRQFGLTENDSVRVCLDKKDKTLTVTILKQ